MRSWAWSQSFHAFARFAWRVMIFGRNAVMASNFVARAFRGEGAGRASGSNSLHAQMIRGITSVIMFLDWWKKTGGGGDSSAEQRDVSTVGAQIEVR